LYPKIRVGAVSYLNTKPLTYGFENGMMANEVELCFAPPAELAVRLQNGEIDLGLVPVATLVILQDAQIVGDYCIGADGPVSSVALFSECPIEQIEEIWLDFESRTSVALLKILLRDHWKMKPKLLEAGPGYEGHIRGKTAGLVIGDRAFVQSEISSYKYDLSEHWKVMTGLPFVFAAWITKRTLAPDFIDRFNEANAHGLVHLANVISKINIPSIDLMKYYTHNIQYRLDDEKRRALSLFMDKVRSLQAVPYGV
jgi:chorismate dehydratase